MQKGGVCGSVGLGLLKGLLGGGSTSSLTGQSHGGDKTLDLSSLGNILAGLVLEGAGNHVFTDVSTLVQVEQSSDLGGTLGSKTTRSGDVSHIGDLDITLLDDDQVAHSDVRGDDASAHRLSLAHTVTTRAEARKTISEQKTDTSGAKDTLLHGETLLVVSTGDTEDLSIHII
jgi:hypothetical protein